MTTKIRAQAALELRKRQAEGALDEEALLDYAETCLREIVSTHPDPRVKLPDENAPLTKCRTCGHVSLSNPEACVWRGCKDPQPEPFNSEPARPKYLNEQAPVEAKATKRKPRARGGLIR